MFVVKLRRRLDGGNNNREGGEERRGKLALMNSSQVRGLLPSSRVRHGRRTSELGRDQSEETGAIETRPRSSQVQHD